MVADLARYEETTDGDLITYRFANGLVVHAEVGDKPDELRILPLTGVQGALLNYLANHPHLSRGKRVFEPFAGSGAFGFMAARLGAERVDLLDLNPRAHEFHRRTLAANDLPGDRVRSSTGDIRDFPVDEPYDLLLANPPFLPTPPCVTGTLTSNGGVDGSLLASVVLERLPALLQPHGEALMILYQLAVAGVPLLAHTDRSRLARRDVEFTPLQHTGVPLADYRAAYERRHPAHREGIRAWGAEIERVWGDDVTLAYYVMHIRPQAHDTGSCAVHDDVTAKFGARYLIGDADPDYTPVDGRRR